jgi:acyl carrier protein
MEENEIFPTSRFKEDLKLDSRSRFLLGLIIYELEKEFGIKFPEKQNVFVTATNVYFLGIHIYDSLP